MPSFGGSSHLGAFFAPAVLLGHRRSVGRHLHPDDDHERWATLEAEYRRRFNSGTFAIDGSLGYLDNSVQAAVFSKGQFNVDDTWRWGFSAARASSSDYIRDFHLAGGSVDPNLLTSQLYVEGFGQGAYSRLDFRFYQSLNDLIVSDKLPLVLPRYQYSYFGKPDSLGGRLSIEAGAFNVLRTLGTNTRRANLTADWSRPFAGALGDLWKFTLHGDVIGYDASNFNQQPNFGPKSQVAAARAQPQAALDFRWPFMRDSGAWGTQIIEPIAQVVVGPQVGNSQVNKYPNEDSLDLEFSDANLFGFNRYPGVDRLDGGVRANVAMHGDLVSCRHDVRRVARTILSHRPGQPVSRAFRPARLGVGYRRARQLRADPLAEPDLSDQARPQVAADPDGGRSGKRRGAEVHRDRRLLL